MPYPLPEFFSDHDSSVIVFDAIDHRCIGVNDAALRTYGYSRAEFIGLGAAALCPAGRASSVLEPAAHGERRTRDSVHRRKDGSEFDADETVLGFASADGPALLLLASDVAKRVRVEEEMRYFASAAARVHRLIAFGHWSSDLATGVVTWSDEMWINARIPKPAGSTSPGTGYEVIKRHMHPDDRKSVVADFNDTVATGRMNRIEYRSFRGDGTMHWEEVLVAREDDESGKPVRLVGTCIDITARKEASERLALIASSDMLTGLANRTLLTERLAAACARAERRGSEMAILFLDVDEFKSVNDTLGHPVGDLMLQSVAARLRALTREEDVVARTGGDEFVIVLEDPAAISLIAAALAQRILEAFREPLNVGDRTLCMSLSIGVACSPADGTDVETLMRNADTAMYHAKREGHGRYRRFEESMHEDVAHRFNLESDLREALRRGELIVHYQPLVTFGGRVIGSEALVRWPHSGIVLPAADFITIAEQTGLIVALDMFVLREACRQNALWRREGRSLTVAVNVSAQSLAEPDFTAGVRAALDDSGLEPASLEIELTEHVVHANPGETARKLGEVRALGVRVALDDFGVGYNSLAILRACPFDTVKLDRTFVSGIASSDVDKIIASSVIFAAHALGARAVAEGVETEGQRAELAALLCDAAQGYFFGFPMSPAQFETLQGHRLPLAAEQAAASPLRGPVHAPRVLSLSAC
jgi:diguanylate cyclase (GGDEF)-like protein/PAS domain S-box-containing protein